MEIQGNIKKAEEIAVKWKAKGLPYNAIYDSCLEMAQWKDEQLREKLKKKMNFLYPPIDDYNEGKLAILKDLYQELFNEYYI